MGKGGKQNQVSAKKETVKKEAGYVKWFNVHKGYGFITCEKDGKDLFVLHSSIKSPIFEADKVEFLIGTGLDGKPMAFDVSVLGLGLGLGLDGESGRCFTCGKEGHMAKDCSGGGGGGGGSRAGDGMCYNCHEPGHMARDCPNPCRKCNQFGHMVKDCPGGGGGGDRNCFKCGELGHFARDCPTQATA